MGVIFRVKERNDKDFPIDVQVITNGYYAGIGRFCRNSEEVKEFIKTYKNGI